MMMVVVVVETFNQIMEMKGMNLTLLKTSYFSETSSSIHYKKWLFQHMSVYARIGMSANYKRLIILSVFIREYFIIM